MRKMILTCLTIALTLAATLAGAESIKGRAGITGRIGFLVPADSEAARVVGPATAAIDNISTDVGLVGGGGLIYGITDRIAADIEVTHTYFGADIGGAGIEDGATTNVSLGGQYRFAEQQKITPFVGAGLDILINDIGGADVDTVLGIHINGGVDYFLMRDLALTAEARVVLADTADIKTGGIRVGNFDPTSFSGTVGARFFFY